MKNTNFEARRMTRKAEQASYLYEVDHLAEIVFFLKQVQYQIHVECCCRQKVDHVSCAPKKIKPTNTQNHTEQYLNNISSTVFYGSMLSVKWLSHYLLCLLPKF